MKIMQTADLRRHLKERDLAPVYFLFGPETYLRGLAAKTIAEFALESADLREFNENRFSLFESVTGYGSLRFPMFFCPLTLSNQA